MKRTIVTMLLLLPAVGSAEITSRAECVLQYMPGVMNDGVAELVEHHCRTTYVGSKYNAKQRAPGEGGMQNAVDCALQHAAGTTSEDAAEAVIEACRALYPEG